MDQIVCNFVQVMNDEKMLTNFIIQVFKELDKMFKMIKPSGSNSSGNKSSSEFGKVATCLYKMTIGDISDLHDLIYFTTKDKDRALSIVQYIQEATKLIDMHCFRNLTTILPKNDNNETYDYVKSVLIDLKNGRTSHVDLFKLLDKTGDGNGKLISLSSKCSSED